MSYVRWEAIYIPPLRTKIGYIIYDIIDIIIIIYIPRKSAAYNVSDMSVGAAVTIARFANNVHAVLVFR
jgi:hypothetical protein